MRAGYRIASGLVALGLVATACASTTRSPAANRAGGGNPAASAGSPSGSGPGGGPSTTGSSVGVAAGAGATAGGSGPSGATAQGAAGEAKVPGKLGRGVSATQIKIGFWFNAKGDACTVIGAAGNSQCGTGADDAELEPLVKWVNANGGLGGRKLVPVILRQDVLASSWASQGQAACEHFTVDNEVFLVVTEGEAGRPFGSNCITSKGVPVIDPAHWPWDEASRRPLIDLFYQPQRAAPEDWVAGWIEGLWRQGFFAKGTKVGLIRFDAAPFARVTEKVLKPRLAAHGITLAEEFELTTPPSVSAYGEMNGQIGSAILQFKNADVDRMLVFETMSEITLFFFPQARSQDFFPVYGVNSFQYLTSAEQNATPEQLRGAIGIGWLPWYDVLPQNDPGGGKRVALCKKLLTGVDIGAGRNPKCDTIFFLKDALDRAQSMGGLNAAGFRAAAESLGTSFEPAASFATRFGSGDHQGPAAYRYVFYDEACSCFKYKGGNRPF